MGDKQDRLAALKVTIKPLLSAHEYADTLMLMDMFIWIFNNKRRHDNTKNDLKQLVYKIITWPIVPIGWLLDVHVNATAGKRLFGKHAKLGTLTATLKRVQDDVGAKVSKLMLVKQICEVLNDYDVDGHC